MDLKTVILSEVRHKGEISHGISYLWNLKRNDTNEFAKQRKTPRLTEQTYVCQGKGCGEGIVREFGMEAYTLL